MEPVSGAVGVGVRFLHPYGVYLLFLSFGRPWLPLGEGGVFYQPACLSYSEREPALCGPYRETTVHMYLGLIRVLSDP